MGLLFRVVEVTANMDSVVEGPYDTEWLDNKMAHEFNIVNVKWWATEKKI